MSAIVLRDFCQRYGRFTAVDTISLHVETGAIYGLVGPNGAGKTTTMRVICTLLAPTSGEVYVNGYAVHEDPRAIRRSLGYMPDAFGVYGELHVWEYLDFYARCYGIAQVARQQTIGDVLALVDLGPQQHHYVQSLSRGMRQRLALARTLLHDPSLLVLDEPAAGLDPRARIELRELLRELQRIGKTILLSSHILADIAEICSHVAILERGRLVAHGPMAEVLSRVHGGRLLVIELLGADELPPDFAQRFPELEQVAAAQEGVRTIVRCHFRGDDAALAAVLGRLVTIGLRVVSFREERSDLEALFMQVTEPLSA